MIRMHQVIQMSDQHNEAVSRFGKCEKVIHKVRRRGTDLGVTGVQGSSNMMKRFAGMTQVLAIVPVRRPLASSEALGKCGSCKLRRIIINGRECVLPFNQRRKRS